MAFHHLILTHSLSRLSSDKLGLSTARFAHRWLNEAMEDLLENDESSSDDGIKTKAKKPPRVADPNVVALASRLVKLAKRLPFSIDLLKESKLGSCVRAVSKSADELPAGCVNLNLSLARVYD